MNSWKITYFDACNRRCISGLAQDTWDFYEGVNSEVPTLDRICANALTIDWSIREETAVHNNMLKGEDGKDNEARYVSIYRQRKGKKTTRTPPEARKGRRKR
jgi:hypothetical protein